MKRNFLKEFWAIVLVVMLAFMACSEEPGHGPLESNTVPPGIVENISIENLPGKVNLSYTLPSDEDLLYVVARYTTENGTQRETKSSYFKNTMVLEGFKGGEPIQVTITAGNKSETESQPVVVTVNPLPAPIFAIFESLEIGPDFGGVNVKASNPTEDDIAILVMLRNNVGDWEPLPTSIYTKSNEINRSLRNLEAVEQDFAITVRDRWGNVTDTLFKPIEPLFEQLMPKSGYVGVRLSNDAGNDGYAVSNLWDDESIEWFDSYFTQRGADPDPTIGHLVTFDIGQETKVSRIHIWNFSEPLGGQRFYYYLGAMRKFTIWGANELNNGDLSGWIRMVDYEVLKPSGLPEGEETAADTEAGENGEDVLISIDKPKVRYLRIECTENWRGLEYMSVNEIAIYGDPNF
ncbi:DUF5000 domain-containing lipoprotein [Tamlana flava]|uniref:DUF5000 domain-containing lipoprotein n=1 Tax=Tamlana flava TaxID=3158572 RepID=UPI00351AE58D